MTDSDLAISIRTYSAHRMLLEESLYRPRKFIAGETWLVLALLYFGGTFDSFCVDCEKTSTFRIKRDVAN